MMRHASLVAAVFASLPVSLSATTWIVDAAGGPGAHFTTIGAAVAAATDGDVIRVRAGRYFEAVRTSKGLALLAESNVRWSAPALSGPLVIEGLPAARSFWIDGFELGVSTAGFPPRGSLTTRNCAGPIHVSKVTSYAAVFSNTWQPVLLVDGCSNFVLRECDLSGGTGLLARRSQIAAIDTRIVGYGAAGSLGGSSTVSYTGLAATDSRLDLANCEVIGGDGYASHIFSWPPRPAMDLSGSHLRVAGDGSTHIRAGVLSGFDVEAVFARSRSTLVQDPSVQLIPSGLGSPWSGPLDQRFEGVPWLYSSDALLGQPFQLELNAAPGAFHQVHIGLPGDPLPVDGRRTWWLFPGSSSLFASGAIGGGGSQSFIIPVPNDPGLEGAVVRFQAWTLAGAVLASTAPLDAGMR